MRSFPRQHTNVDAITQQKDPRFPKPDMTAKSPFIPRLSLSRGDKSPVLPFHNTNTSSRPPPFRSQPSEYDLDDLSPRPDETFLSPDFHDPNSPLPQNTKAASNRKPTGALNRRPSNSSSGGSSSKARRFAPSYQERVLFNGPPPPIAVSRVLYRDEEQRYSGSKYDDDEDDHGGVAASWLPGTARRAISSVMWDRSEPQDLVGERPVVYDRNSVWRGLARREKAIVHDVQRYLQVQETSLGGGGDAGERSPSVSDAGSSTPTGTSNNSSTSRNPRRSVSFLEPVTRSGPGGEVIPVRQPQQKKLGIGGARKGITQSLTQLADLKEDEMSSLLAALSTRKQALGQLRRLATRHESIAEELRVLETDDQEPLAKELGELDTEYKGICSEIQELEARLASLKSRKRHLEGRIDDVTNRREAGLSGYKNALREVDDSVKGFLARPPVKPLDLEALAENLRDESPPSSPGGVEFMHLRPERRTIDMARDWWEAEVAILEKRTDAVNTERAALEEGREVWQEVVGLVLEFEADLRRQVLTASTASSTADLQDKGKGKSRELVKDDESPPQHVDVLRQQYARINTVVAGLDQRLAVAERKGWNLLIAAIGAEVEAFREAADLSRAMLTTAGVTIDEEEEEDDDDDHHHSRLVGPAARVATYREDSGTTGTSASFHTVNGGGSSSNMNINNNNTSQQLLNLPSKNREDEHPTASAAAESDDNEVPHDLLTTAPEEAEEAEEAEEEGEHPGEKRAAQLETTASSSPTIAAASGIAPFDREDSENEVPPEFLVEHHDARD